MGKPLTAAKAEAKMSSEDMLDHRLALATKYLGWSGPRINAFRQGFADARTGHLDQARIARHSDDDSFEEGKLTPALIDSLGYRDGAVAGEEFAKGPAAAMDKDAIVREAYYWSDNGDNDFEIDDAEWSYDVAHDLDAFLRIKTRRQWINWFVAEHNAAIEAGRDGYGDLLLQDIKYPILYIDYIATPVDPKLDVWDGWHRIGAAMLKGAGSIPAIKGVPAALINIPKIA